MEETGLVADATAVAVRPMVEADLDAADRIFRIAFGTYLGVPNPEGFFGDADPLRTRWKANPNAGVVAELDGLLIGSNFATNWGSVGFFGPTTVAPEHWDKGVAQRLIESTMETLTAWNTRHVGLFTFADSAKHVGLYQKHGFWPRFLTAIMSRPVDAVNQSGWSTLSGAGEANLAKRMSAVRDLTDAVYPGLDVSVDVDAVRTQRLGETVLIDDNSGLQAMAICHVGPGTEAGSGTCFIKFGAVRPGPDAPRTFGLLIDACSQLAADRGASVLLAGANAGRDKAWKALKERGFRVGMQGVAMHRPNEPGYNTSDSFVIDDWR